MNKVKEITISAVIPTTQYGNIQPSITVEIDGDVEGAKQTALEHIVGISKLYAEDGRELEAKSLLPVDLEKVESLITGGVAYKDSHNHFWTADGKRFKSPSSFLKKYKKPFPKDFILPKMVGAYGGEAADWEDMWSLQGEVSTQLGKAIHAGIELYGKYSVLGEKAGAKEGINKALATQPYVQWAVLEYFKDNKPEDNDYEVLLLDEDELLMGLVDIVHFVDREKKIIRVRDLKTNADLHKKEEFLAPFNTLAKEVLSGYRIQLSWYADIFEKYGYTVEGLDIDHLTKDGWERTSIERVDLKGVK